jgi:hypothetical protein
MSFYSHLIYALNFLLLHMSNDYLYYVDKYCKGV